MKIYFCKLKITDVGRDALIPPQSLYKFQRRFEGKPPYADFIATGNGPM